MLRRQLFDLQMIFLVSIYLLQCVLDDWLKKSGELVYQMVNSLICLCIHVILEDVNFLNWFQDFGLEIILVPIKLSSEAAASAD